MAESPDSWWNPRRHADRRPILLARNRIKSALRDFLDGHDFTEVDPAALAISPGNETHLHGFATQAIGNDGLGVTRYLHTSPEFAMKKLLAAGERRIHAFAHVWRNRERGALHSPEFTMLEWYRADEAYDVLMADTCAMIALAARATGVRELRFRDRSCDPFAPPERLGVAEAFLRHAGIDLMATMDDQGATDVAALAAAMTQAGIAHGDGETWSDLFSRVLSERVEPHLGLGRITILDEYPAAEAALARRKGNDPRISERFEVYACAVELANGFGELIDPAEQRRRFQAEMAEKTRLYGESYPMDEDLLSALSLMPPTCGIALGFDRLVMLATHVPRIEDVLWTPPA